MGSLRKAKQLAAQLPYIIENTGMVHSTPAQSAVITPVVGDDVDDKVVAGLSWGETMELEDNLKRIQLATSPTRNLEVIKCSPNPGAQFHGGVPT